MNKDIKLSKDIKLNSKALMKNLENSEEKLKKGVKLVDALNEVDIMWSKMSQEERDFYRDRLKPRPTRTYTRELMRLIKKYGD